jgi:hypothetical protein
LQRLVAFEAWLVVAIDQGVLLGVEQRVLPSAVADLRPVFGTLALAGLHQRDRRHLVRLEEAVTADHGIFVRVELRSR